MICERCGARAWLRAMLPWLHWRGMGAAWVEVLLCSLCVPGGL